MVTEKPKCLCGQEMAFFMDNKGATLWECPSCGRLLCRPHNANWQHWYIPESRV